MANYESLKIVTAQMGGSYDHVPPKVLSFRCIRAGTTFDYTPYLSSKLKKTDRRNETKLLQFTLAPWGTDFLKLRRGDYIIIDTANKVRWFTGYIVAEPTTANSGVDGQGVLRWQYNYQAVSDDYLLSVGPLPMGLRYANTTQGAILRDLVSRVQPGMFDVSGIEDGFQVATYSVDSQKRFSDVVKEFATASNSLWSAKDHALSFQSIAGMQPTVIIDGNDRDFTPSKLSITNSPDPLINDCTVLGGVEPQGTMVEYFPGDGDTARFHLIAGAYGVDNNLWLDEVFSGTTVDTQQTWDLEDPSGEAFVIDSGYMNVLGGSGSGNYDTYLQTINPIPLEGHLRLTHGQWDFVDVSWGVICALYTQSPPPSPSGADENEPSIDGCFYGIHCRADSVGSGTTLLRPVINGQIDNTQQFRIYQPYNYRYIIRTVIGFNQIFRAGHQYGYIDSNGGAGAYGGGANADTATIQTYITTIDPLTGNTVAQDVWTNYNVAVDAATLVAYYTPVLNRSMHCSFTGITISNPLQAALDVKATSDPTFTVKGGGDINFMTDFFHDVIMNTNTDCSITARITFVENQVNGWTKGGVMIRSGLDPTAPHCSVVITAGQGGGVKYRTSNGGNTVLASWSTTHDQQNNYQNLVTPPYWARVVLKGTQLSAYSSVDGESWDLLTTMTWVYNGPVMAGLVSCADTASSNVLSEAIFDNITVTDAFGVVQNPAYFFDAEVGSGKVVGYSTNDLGWQRKIVGPNEIDSLDGMAPVGTIQESGSGNGAALTRVASPNPGNCELVFFKDSSTQSSYIPNPGDLIRLTYQRAGVAISRVVDANSIEQEALAWGDSGHRAVIRSDVSPAPRTTDECEAAAGAILQDNSLRHYEGTYSLYNTHMLGTEPIAGTTVVFRNLSTDDFPGLSAEVIQQVVTTFLASTPIERFQYDIQFGKVPLLQSVAGQFRSAYATQTPNQDAAELPDAISLDLLLQSTLPNVTNPQFIAWTRTQLQFDCGSGGAGYEVRYTDDQWGADDGKNLATRIVNKTTFSLPRNSRDKVVYIREFDQRNKLLWSEDLTKSAWHTTGNPPVPTLSTSLGVNPDGKMSSITTVVSHSDTEPHNAIYQNTTIPAAKRTCVFSISLRGPAGLPVLLNIKDSLSGVWVGYTTVTLGSDWEWERFSVATTFPATSPGDISTEVTPLAVGTFQVTRASLEVDRTEETVYCKTAAIPYGLLSRFSAGLHVRLPQIPPPPTATIDYSDITAPVLTIQLPTNPEDIWGYEIRASDKTTVLASKDLASTTFELPQYKISGNKDRNLSFYIYSYNVFGEYSDTPFNAVASIPAPVVSNAFVDDDTKQVKWTGNNAQYYQVEVSLDDPNMKSDIVFSAQTADQYQALLDKDFFPHRYIRITPFDAIGPGTASSVIDHTYAIHGFVEWDTGVVYTVDAPATPNTDPNIPTKAQSFSEAYRAESWRTYTGNRWRYNQDSGL